MTEDGALREQSLKDVPIGDRIEAVAAAGRAWRDPDYGPREEAVAATLNAPNAFTEEAIAFAVNQQTSLLSSDALRRWIRAWSSVSDATVGVLNAGNIPFVGLQDFLAVILTGFRYVGTRSSKSPALLAAFVSDIVDRCPGLCAEFVDAEYVFDTADAVVATGGDDTAAWVREQCERHGISESNRLVRGHRFSAAVLSGQESEDDLERLAEDALLHEGFGCRNVAVIWAPAGSAPDLVLDALARFRAVFPAHADTPGRLKMQQAFLEAVETPHAFGEGLEFLVSKGDPGEQAPGHVRWTEYEDLEDVNGWLRQNSDRIQLVVAADDLAGELDPSIDTIAFGEAQRPPLDWCPDGTDVLHFLRRLDK